MKLSEVFREAQIYLGKDEFSCNAIRSACRAGVDYWLVVYAIDFAEKCGVYCNWTRQFDEFKYGEERQGARFMWLEMLALIAEDEGR